MLEKTNNCEEKQETIQDIALKVVEEQMRTLQLERDAKERTVFFLGSKGAGKSTVINKFFDREDGAAIKPTMALEYCYGRRTGQTPNLQKQVLNVWELGTLENADDLIAVPINTHGVVNLAVVLMLDLSQPQTLWHDFQMSYNGLITALHKKLSAEQLKQRREQTAIRLKKDNLDNISSDLVPFPMVIVGAKYDVFANFDMQLKQHVCQCLRSLAQLLGAAILFYTQKIPKLSKTLRDTISHLGFGSPTNPFRSHVTDPNEPLSIWFGTDAWNLIYAEQRTALTMQQISDNYTTAVPQKTLNSAKKNITNPAKDAGFKEDVIDEMRAQKDEELLALLRETDIRSQFENITN